MSYNTEIVKNTIYINDERITEFSFHKKSIYDFFKRVFDIIISLMALVILAIPIVVIAIIINAESSGNVVFCQERLKQNGEKFFMYKFRTMHMDAEKNGAKWADKNDNRVTHVGKILRVYHLDEVLQFINVLKGDLSIVGPRPEREIFHRQFCGEVTDWEKRLLVKQGLTGLAQVSGGYDLKPSEKIVYDLEYIQKRSLWLDIKILCETVVIIFSKKGAR